MKKIEKFFKTYVRETLLVVVSVFLMLCVYAGADKTSESGSIYGTFSLIIPSVIFCVTVVVLGRHILEVKTLERLKFLSAVVFLAALGILIAYSAYVQQVFPASDLIKLGCCGIICTLVNGGYLDARGDQLKELELLKENRPDEYLRALIRAKHELTEIEQLTLFNLGDEEHLLFQYMQYAELYPMAEIKLIEQPYLLHLLQRLPRYAFSDDGDARLFYQPNTPELVLQYIQNGNCFNSANELKMFDLPNAAEVVDAYIAHNPLSDEAEMRLFELPNARELVEYYAEEYDMSDEAYNLAEEKGWA
ncbi:MAG: hypothetical protein IJ770_02620 [Alphaproteobacteria bacterium]|nr:hypothetical protein [Alphaproteobacteria bacterium]